MNSHFTKIASSVALLAAVLPGVAAAATLDTVLGTAQGLIGLIVPIILALAVVFFMWGVLQYITKAGEEQTKARDQMLWGIIAIAVIVSIWGLVGILQSTFGIDSSTNKAPTGVDLIPTQ